jgi:DUF1680 family protein
MLIRVAQRLLLLDADARYADVIERVMYNNLAANVGLCGTTFFYHNRLSARSENAQWRPDLPGGIVVIRGKGRRRTGSRDEIIDLMAVPYAVWANRDVGEMDVWLRE